MKPTNGNVFITVEKTMIDQLESGLFQDLKFRRHHKVVISGEVVAVPRMGNKEAIAARFDGEPSHKLRRLPAYRASDYPCTIQEKDRIYFHYLTLESAFNYVAREGKKQMYRVPVSDIFCSVRDGQIVMNLNYVLGTAYEPPDLTDVHEFGVKGNEKKLKGGKKLVTNVRMKADVNIAVIHHIGEGVYEQRKDIKRGDLVLLTPNSEFENRIEGTDYWVFKHEDIIAVNRGGLVAPVGDYVMIQADKFVKSGGVEVDPAYMGVPHSGVVVSWGDQLKRKYKRGDRVLYTLRDVRMVMSNLLIIREGNIQCHEYQQGDESQEVPAQEAEADPGKN